MCIIAVYGFMFGWLARWRKSLRPGMIAHTLQDSVAMLFG
jgi:membrane protease YdiL (CAAX protease family)